MDWNFIIGVMAVGLLLVGSAMLLPKYNAWVDRRNRRLGRK